MHGDVLGLECQEQSGTNHCNDGVSFFEFLGQQRLCRLNQRNQLANVVAFLSPEQHFAGDTWAREQHGFSLLSGGTVLLDSPLLPSFGRVQKNTRMAELVSAYILFWMC